MPGDETAEHGIARPQQRRERQQKIRLPEKSAAPALARINPCPDMNALPPAAGEMKSPAELVHPSYRGRPTITSVRTV